MKQQRLLMAILVMILVLGILPIHVNAQDDMAETNKSNYRRLIDEAWNEGNLEVVNELVAPDFVAHTPQGDIPGPDGLSTLVIGNLQTAMPDLNMRIDVLIAEADWVGSRVTLTGTFDGNFLTSRGPIPPNGQPVVLTFNLIDRFNENGQFVEEWTEYDGFAFLVQLGAIPMPEGEADEMTYGMAEQGELSADADTEANKAAVMQLVEEAFNMGNTGVIDEITAPDYMAYDPGGVLAGGAEELKGFATSFRAAIPDLNIGVTEILAEGDWVAFRLTINGTFTEAFALPDGSSLEPTGQPLNLTTNLIVRFNENGQIVEEWEEFDNLTFLTQLGLFSMEE